MKQRKIWLQLVDWWLRLCGFVWFTPVPQKTYFRVDTEYSLSRNYQLKQNAATTTRLVLPLDVCNAMLYIVFMTALALLRNFRGDLAPEQFYGILEWITVVITAGISTILRAQIL